MSCKLFRILLIQPIYYQQQTTHLKFDLCLLLLCCVALLLLLLLAARVAQRRAYHQHEWGAVCAFGYCIMFVHARGSRDEMNNERRAPLSHRGNNSLTHSLAVAATDRSKNTYSANRFHIYSGGGSNFKTRRNKMVRIDGINMECKKADCRRDPTREREDTSWSLCVLFPGDRDQTTASQYLFSTSLCSCRFFKAIKRLLQAMFFFFNVLFFRMI